MERNSLSLHVLVRTWRKKIIITLAMCANSHVLRGKGTFWEGFEFDKYHLFNHDPKEISFYPFVNSKLRTFRKVLLFISLSFSVQGTVAEVNLYPVGKEEKTFVLPYTFFLFFGNSFHFLSTISPFSFFFLPCLTGHFLRKHFFYFFLHQIDCEKEVFPFKKEKQFFPAL